MASYDQQGARLAGYAKRYGGKTSSPKSTNTVPFSPLKPAQYDPAWMLRTGPRLEAPKQIQPASTVAPAPIPTGGGGGGGGIAAGASAAAAPPPMTIDDFLKNNFLRVQEENEGRRRLEDFDAETLRLTQETEADQALRRAALQRRLEDAGLSNAEDMAGRGLLRSGLTFQNQDRIDEEGVEQNRVIDQLLTNLITQRGQGRIAQQAQNRHALNQVIAKLTDQFNAQQLAQQGA